MLIIDDHPDTIEVLSTVFNRLGHVSQCAVRGRDALRIARVFEPDLVLLDIDLPDINGYEVVRALRADPRHPHRYIAAVTGWVRAQDVRRAIHAGFNEHVAKPLDLAKIRQVIRHAEAALPAPRALLPRSADVI